MRPAFGILRHVEQRESNGVVTERGQNSITTSVTVYPIVVTRIIILWLTVWTHESEFSS